MFLQLITPLLLGLVGGIVPGPVMTATFTEILQSNFLKSLRIVFLAMFVETFIALVTLLLLSSIGFSPAVFQVLSFIGAGVLVWIATQLWNIKTLDTDTRVHFGFGKIAAMILANGVLWTFWITVCVPQAIALNQQIPFGQFIFLFLVEIGWLVSTVGVAFAFSLFRGLLSNPKIIPLMFRFFAFVFVYFALTMIYGSALYFLG